MVFFENGFSKITFDIGKVGSRFLHHRVSLVKTSRNIRRMTLKGQLQNLTSDLGRVMTQVDPNRSYCTSFDAPWCGKHNEPILMSAFLLNQNV